VQCGLGFGWTSPGIIPQTEQTNSGVAVSGGNYSMPKHGTSIRTSRRAIIVMPLSISQTGDSYDAGRDGPMLHR